MRLKVAPVAAWRRRGGTRPARISPRSAAISPSGRVGHRSTRSCLRHVRHVGAPLACTCIEGLEVTEGLGALADATGYAQRAGESEGGREVASRLMHVRQGMPHTHARVEALK